MEKFEGQNWIMFRDDGKERWGGAGLSYLSGREGAQGRMDDGGFNEFWRSEENKWKEGEVL